MEELKIPDFLREFVHREAHSAELPREFVGHAKAQSTGFPEEMVHGRSRNIVFPREFAHAKAQSTGFPRAMVRERAKNTVFF